MRLAAIAALLFACAPLAAQSIAGRVLEDHTGNPLALVEIRLLKPGQRAVVAELETDAEGRFRSPEVAAGEYTLEFAKANYGNATLHLPAGQSATVRLVRGGVIAGTVTDPKGQPIPGAKVFTMVKSANSAVLRPTANVTAVDERGQYRIFGLPPGQYGVAVSYDAAAKGAGAGVLFFPNNQRPRLFTVSGGEEFAGTDFAIQPQALFKVSGKVELPRKGVQMELSLASADQPALSYASMESAKDGTFTFEGIAPGSYELFASGPTNGYAYLGATLEPKAFFGRTRLEVIQNVESLSVTLQPAKAVAVELRGRAAACPVPATVTFSPLEAWHIMGDRSVQARIGEPQLVEQLAPGRYQINVTKLGSGCYQSGTTVVDVGAMNGPAPVAVTVAQAGAIRGKLVGGTGQYVVVLMAEDADLPVQIAMPDAESKFGFAALQPGRYRVAVRPAAEARWVTDTAQMIELDVAGGGPTDVELPCPAAKQQ
uniref:Cna B domain protein n=1 Tax=Solibacter usitatus (strain Ellin6076) TaxID=234267 RepID=Q01NB9_SOLUE